ncbi:hypothetical protein WN51_07685 [Melipona quadrifasciata]|uniref:Uncharacterized protein n=1 Tax=Melipona quadrifasciata TaxID=166423 RepID=A0A0M9A8X0_9HYME|nr:hypothetical protein WN51_07685 [Melipona quadrifasciata]
MNMEVCYFKFRLNLTERYRSHFYISFSKILFAKTHRAPNSQTAPNMHFYWMFDSALDNWISVNRPGFENQFLSSDIIPTRSKRKRRIIRSIRLGHSLWSANQLPAQGFLRKH